MRIGKLVARAVAEDRLKVRALLADLRVRRLAAAELSPIDLERELLNVNRRDELEALRRPGHPGRRGG